ncbi:MAG: metallophosphoesterase, partial [Chitinispirillaceae bacterium]|nr:metallophosphoesterase [Chitinispirillaceae bacterium]
MLYRLLSCMLVSIVVTSSGAAVKKGPYLVWNGDNTQMSVLWQLDGTETGSIMWGTTQEYEMDTVPTNEYGDHQHLHTIENLDPGTRYYYNVPGVGSGSFTAAPPSDARNVTLYDYGDCQDTVAVQARLQSLIMQEYLANPDLQTLCLRNGDWVNSNDETNWTNLHFNMNYDTLVRFLSEVPMCGPRGNHEATGTVFRKYYPFPYVNGFYWSFDYGPVHVTVIDEYTSFSTGSDQLNWLENDLASSPKQWKMIILHEPGWSAYGRHANNADVQNYLQPLCTAYGVDLVMAGHNHYYARAEVDGVMHVTSGGGGAILVTPDPTQPNIVAAEKVFHYCKIDIRGSILTFSAIRRNGSEIETFQIIHSPFVELTAPAPDAELEIGIETMLSASVIEAGSTCTGVAFYADYGSGDEPVGQAAAEPWTVSWTPSRAGLNVMLTAHVEVDSEGTILHVVSEPVRVIISDPDNVSPVARVGADITVTDLLGDGSETVTLYDEGSFDPDGTIMSRTWKEGETILGSGMEVSASFTPGMHLVVLEVQDNGGKTSADTVRVNVQTLVNELPVADAGENQFLTDDDGNGSEPVTLDAGNSFDTDGSIVLYEWDIDNNGTFDSIRDFGQPTLSYNAARGAARFILRITDNNGVTALDSVSVEVFAPGELETVSVRVSQGSDDAEEDLSGEGRFSDIGDIDLTSTDLELGRDGGLSRDQIVAIRFNACGIPHGALIKKACIQFTCDETGSDATTVLIRGEAADNPAGYSSTPFDITNRTATAASVEWTIEAWNTPSEAAAAQQTPDIASIIQEIADRGGFSEQSSLAFSITGSGTRIAESYDGSPTEAPLLQVLYTYEGSVNQPPVCTITSPAPGDPFLSPASCMIAATASDVDGSVETIEFFADDLPLGICYGNSCSVEWDGIGSGVYAITAIATDDGGKHDTAEVTITVDLPPDVVTVTQSVQNKNDDAEENLTNGSMDLTSSDLELIEDTQLGRTQVVGVRFSGTGIPKNAVINFAYIQFTCDEISTNAASLIIHGEDTDNPAAYSSTDGDISSRPVTGASVAWILEPWGITDVAGLIHRTP